MVPAPFANAVYDRCLPVLSEWNYQKETTRKVMEEYNDDNYDDSTNVLDDAASNIDAAFIEELAAELIDFTPTKQLIHHVNHHNRLYSFEGFGAEQYRIFNNNEL